MLIGIMGAMHEEVASLSSQVENAVEKTVGQRTYYLGQLKGTDVVIVFSGWGKVASASTATTLIDRFEVDMIFFTGVAGAVKADLNIGDIVIGTKLIQHDLDASPIFPRHTVPILGIDRMEADEGLCEKAKQAARQFVSNELVNIIDPEMLKEFNLSNPAVVTGTIASGDQFISDSAIQADIVQRLPDVLCVEMEGAAVAQVCHEHKVPFVVVRCISDKADHQAGNLFQDFVSRVARYYSLGIATNFIALCNAK